jgi:hypothetical protein
MHCAALSTCAQMLCGTAASNTNTVRPFELVVIVKECERGQIITRLLLPVTLQENENELAWEFITLITVRKQKIAPVETFSKTSDGQIHVNISGFIITL